MIYQILKRILSDVEKSAIETYVEVVMILIIPISMLGGYIYYDWSLSEISADTYKKLSVHLQECDIGQEVTKALVDGKITPLEKTRLTNQCDEYIIKQEKRDLVRKFSQ